MPLSRNVHVCKLFVCIVQWVKLNVKKSILKSCKRDSHLSRLSEERELKKNSIYRHKNDNEEGGSLIFHSIPFDYFYE